MAVSLTAKQAKFAGSRGAAGASRAILVHHAHADDYRHRPTDFPTNPTGTIIDANGVETFTAPELARAGVFPLTLPTGFYSALLQNPFDFEWDGLTFGTDGALNVTKGWDNVTGLGTPNGEAFVDFFARPGAGK